MPREPILRDDGSEWTGSHSDTVMRAGNEQHPLKPTKDEPMTDMDWA
jgi:hypothetical protein